MLDDTDVTRSSLTLLDTFLGKQMQDILDRLRGLRRLCWTLNQCNLDHGAWWKEQITRCVSGHLHPAAFLDIQIVLSMHSGLFPARSTLITCDTRPNQGGPRVAATPAPGSDDY